MLRRLPYFGLLWFAPVGGPNSDQRVEITRGSTVKEIGENLEAQGLVRSGKAFQLLARVKGVDHALRAGHYRLQGSMWSWTVLDQLVSGQLQTKAVTIPEGLTLTQIAERVEDAGLADANAFIDAARDKELLDEYGLPTPSFEGFLFPKPTASRKGLMHATLLRQWPRSSSNALRRLFPTELPQMNSLKKLF